MDAEFHSARDASGALDSVGDYDTAKAVALGSIGQVEGMHYLAPDNADGLFLLTKTWFGVGYAFIEDDKEAAEDRGDDARAEYERKRARMAYDRAISYALQLLDQRAPGFNDAKKEAKSLDKWLRDNFTTKDDAVNLFWASAPWLARINLMKSDENEGAVFIAEAYVGLAMLERAYTLDPAVEHYQAMLAMAGYHARGPMFGEMDQAKTMFDTVMAKTGGKSLVVPLTYAMTYACVKGDGALYKKLMTEILDAPDVDPDLRLQNAIAKRRAARWLGRKRVMDTCGFDPDAAVSSK
ncbi:MAG TPA: TRAP transporter TatT component family protein [Polyangia bacterium]|nr:TRAP transporter TatT component family protein [Polyangia bacterium]